MFMHFTTTCSTWLRCKLVPGRTQMACVRYIQCAEMAAGLAHERTLETSRRIHLQTLYLTINVYFCTYFISQKNPIHNWVSYVCWATATLCYLRLIHEICWSIFPPKGGGPRVVVSTAAFHARVRDSVLGPGGLKETKMFLHHPRVKVSIVGSLRVREVACSASDHQGSNFGSCVWRTVSSQSSHHPQEVLLAQFSLYVHKGGLKPDLFHFIFPPVFQPHVNITL